MTALAAATLGCLAASAEATTPTVFKTLPSPVGITLGLGNNVFVTSDADDYSTTHLTKYSPAGQQLGRVDIGERTVGDIGKLATDPVTGRIWDLSANGMLRSFDPNTLVVQVERDLKGLDVSQSATHIYNVRDGESQNQSGSVLPPYSSYGDIALYRSGPGNSRLDAFVTARTTSYNIPYVLRLTWINGVFQQPVAVVMSNAIYWVGVPRGITVTPSGTVLTSLPRVGRLGGDFTDQIISFPVTYPESGGPPTVELQGWDASSRGMASDSRGYIYMTSQINSSLCGMNAGGAIMVLSPNRAFQGCYPYSLLGDGEDVAVRSSDFDVYSTIADEEEVYPVPHEVLEWGRLAGSSLTVRKLGGGSGTVTGISTDIDCGNTCSSAFSPGTQVTLQVVADNGSVFDGWSGEGCSGTGNCVVTVDSDKMVSARFSLVQERLTVSKQGNGSGTITSVGGQPNAFAIGCGLECTADFTHFSEVQLFADADPGSTLTGWTGSECEHNTQQPEICDVFMDSNKHVAAVFSSNTVPPSYPRPKGATPMRVSLVPAYKQCQTPNVRHGAPFTYALSCAPPAQASSELTVGTPDANGRSVNSIGSVDYRVVLGDPGAPPDEADVQLIFKLTDIRRKGSLADYTGELVLDTPIRITDRLNRLNSGPPTLDQAATVEDGSFAATVPCVATESTTTGGQCSLTTTFDSIRPGAILESKRSIWELGKVNVLDGGPDGLASTSPNTLFATQGIFAP